MKVVEGIELPEIPENWQLMARSEDGYVARYRHLQVIVSIAKEDDNKRWLHVSIFRKGGWLCSWDDVKFVKTALIGADKTAMIMLPPENKFININETHHLWHCLDGDVTPDFTQGTNEI